MDRRELLGSVSIFASLGEKEMDTLLQATTMKKNEAEGRALPKGRSREPALRDFCPARSK